MTDINVMLSSRSLDECKEEIDRQFKSLAEHGNEMKAAITASFFLQASVETINKIDPAKFMDSLRDELLRLISSGEEWRQSGNMMREHLEKNKDVISAFERTEYEVSDLTRRITTLLDEYDGILRRLCLDRSKKSIAEIQADIQNLNK
ncbi:MAG: hypothetical protein K2F63_04410 [Muribaculaceae bacterium]|nr:hypothetical protein [Muribaculaceae bacterium]MDE6134209.1 hypothetical protein [Muribaculaceae bacterium]